VILYITQLLEKYFYAKSYDGPLLPQRAADEQNTAFQEAVVVLDCVLIN